MKLNMINIDEALDRLDHDTDIYVDLVTTFLDLSPPDFTEFRELQRSGRETELAGRVHRLRGAALTLGCERLAEPLSKLETSIRQDIPADRAGLLDESERRYAETVSELVTIRDTLQKQN